eukprot:TRINITY_DN103459_c0_g1_i1.p1 TRINITY_DN103459_c0_g1~~TRINITY_DN103459_c0_g1_i1.p1  ORF type:complete len:413 (-),score=98.40 TRINITY_DN103459_c0_g1_i1:212-1450(-)
MKFAVYGSDIPYAEPAWYRGAPTPYYTESHAKFRETVRKFMEDEIIPFRDDWDEQGNFPLEELRLKAAAAGVLAPWAPKELGGTPPEGGWDWLHFLIWVDETSRSGAGGITLLLFQVAYMCVPHTLYFGSPWLKEHVAKPVVEGKQAMCITLTEPQGGSDLANIRTTAKKSADGQSYVVTGQKKFITGGSCCDYFSTLVRTGGDGMNALSLLLIPKESPGVTVRKLPAQGWWAGNTTHVDFNEVVVPTKYLIGKEGAGFKMMATVMNGERIIAAQGAVRQARMLLEESVKFARQRVTFGKRLIEHQVIRHKIAQMARRVEASQASCESLAYSMTQGATPADIGGPTALLKVDCTSALEFCAREASQILGGASYVRTGKGQLVERLCREVRVACVGGGSEEVMLDLAMRQAKL